MDSPIIARLFLLLILLFSLPVRAQESALRRAARLDADRVAAALLAGIQGGVGVMLATGDLGYLEAALDVGIESLRPVE